MNATEQTALLLAALDYGFLNPDEIIRWADVEIAASSTPPAWLIELSTLARPYKEEIGSLLRQQAEPLPQRRTIELIALAWDRRLITLGKALGLLFDILILAERTSEPRDQLEESLCEALVECDCQEDWHVIHPSLEAKAETVLRQYLLSATAIAPFVPLKCQSSLKAGGLSNGHSQTHGFSTTTNRKSWRSTGMRN